MANQIVHKLDANRQFVQEFASVREAQNDAQVCGKTFKKRVMSGQMINEYFYVYQDKEPYRKLVHCDYCGKEFVCTQQRIKNHKNLFCSPQCASEYRKSLTEPNCICPICNKPFHIKPSYLDKAEHHYCSIQCHKIAKMEYMKGDKNHQFGLKGDLNASWKSDERVSVYGYRLIRNLDHPFANCDGFVFEHRLIAEQYLLTDENSIEIDGQKYLHPDYTVHHKDFDKLNNDVDNLQVLTRAEHMALHHRLRREHKYEI